ncbi:MAG TPA: class I SAM-dependent methyltransferase [Solirubrobacteraceae bacterium]|nr:class I SAM-dependent methyltransferase [Solirubrobacteraceae bacterium]
MNRLAARLYDRVLRGSEEAGLTAIRRDALAEARGEVLEIGAGTGLNLRAYPREGITRIVVTEPNPAMSRHIAEKLDQAPAPVEIVAASAERLPFSDASFDTVVGTLVLCEPRDPAAVVDEVARVLRPGGRFLFLEHVRSEDDPRLARRQDRLAPLWRAFSGGCTCNRTTLATIEASGLDVEHASMGRFPKAPSITRPLLRGAAVRGDLL